MNILIEICLYLFITLGIICSTVAIFGNSYNIPAKYKRKANGKSQAILELRFIDEEDDEIQKTSYALANGNFDNIYDLVDEFKIYKKA